MKFSVIVPCYNVENTIEVCMNSLLNQSIGLNHLEIILVDDCSTDSTPDILRHYEAQFPEQIMVIFCEKNGRQGTARNIGLSYASGDYISFVDSDDWIRQDMYEILSNIIYETDSDIIQFDHYNVYSYQEDEPLHISTSDFTTYALNSADERRKILLNSAIVNQSCWAKVYRRQLVSDAGVHFAEGSAYEEPLFTFPLKFYAQKITRLYAPLYYYRYNEFGVTAFYLKKPSTIFEHLNVQLQTLQFMRNTSVYDQFRTEIDFYFTDAYFVQPFYFFHYRGFPFSAGLFRHLRDNLLRQVPNYKENPYLFSTTYANEFSFLQLIELPTDISDSVIENEIRILSNSIS